MTSLPLPFDDGPEEEGVEASSIDARIEARDRSARVRAVDPRFNVALEASAGTGKTRVLVDRYVNLLRAGVDPSNILAMTFTRKAAAEMRERILASLRTAAEQGGIPPSRWRELRDRMADIAISTIDAFCLSLLREFPLEADLDPGFAMADDTEVPRLVDEALDRALRICRAVARQDEHVALVFAQIGDRRARSGLAALLERRIVAPAVLSTYLAKGPADLTVSSAARRGAGALLDVFASMRGGLDRFVETGPLEPAFQLLRADLLALERQVLEDEAIDGALLQTAFARAREHFLTQDGQLRTRVGYKKSQFFSPADWQAHRDLVVGHAGGVRQAYAAYRRDLNVLVSRGVRRMFAIAESEYRRTLEAHAVLDFSEVLLRALQLLRQMEEFAQSRYRLEARYHHVLVDEFQDTSRAQWELVALLIESWGEGAGLTHTGPLRPSVFIVGDRKQSIYGFRDADVAVLREASRHLEALRPDGDVRRTISRSFRAVPALLALVNDVCADIDKAANRDDAFRYDEEDRFPIAVPDSLSDRALGALVEETPEASARRTAQEIARLIASGAAVRDRDTGIARAVRPGDIAILFRTRESHREFEDALDRAGVASYVYKGLGFFATDEIKDVLALLWYLADPLSDLRAAAWMRSRFARISDEGLRVLAPRLAEALRSPEPPPAAASLDAADAAALALARAWSARWRSLVDRVPPSELLDTVLTESAYAMELRGPRLVQARENLKKIRALVRRVQNRGYSTLGRVAAHLDRLAVGDESNAAVDAADAVSLMTVHAAKGLEFPVVFIVNLTRGTGTRPQPIRVTADARGEAVSVAVGDFPSETDEDALAREREETKRLVYVAMTRARDRLYLVASTRDGRLQPARGSLGEVLPATLIETLNGATGHVPSVEWVASSGTRHVFAVPARDDWPADDDLMSSSEVSPSSGPVVAADFAPLRDSGTPRSGVAEVASAATSGSEEALGPSSSRLLGTLVHRLLQRHGLAVTDPDALRSSVATLIRAMPDVEPLDSALLERAVEVYLALGRHDAVRAEYSAGDVYHELPFTLRTEAGFVRGTIDCLVRTEPGRFLVLEFKTGRERPDHAAQAAVYRRAIAEVFPEAEVAVHIIYPAASGV